MSVGNNLVAAIVPAKMTSIRTPGKNASLLGEKPLFMHSVDLANRVPEIQKCYVSTESPIIEKLAEADKCTVVRRNQALSSPEVTNREVIKSFLKIFAESSERAPDILIVLQPTHPFRCAKTLSKAIKRFERVTQASSLVTVRKIMKAVGRVSKEGWWETRESLLNSANQDCSENSLYLNLGNFYIFRIQETFNKGQYFGEHILPYELEVPLIDVDIDYPEDLDLARHLEQDAKNILFPNTVRGEPVF